MNTDECCHLQYQILASQLGGERLGRIVILQDCTFRILLERVLYFFTIHIEKPYMHNDISGHPFSQALISNLSSVTTCLVGFYICLIPTSLPMFCILLLWLVLHVSRNFRRNFLFLSSMNYVFNSIKYFYQRHISCYITTECNPVTCTKPSTVLTTCIGVYQCGVCGYFFSVEAAAWRPQISKPSVS